MEWINKLSGKSSSHSQSEEKRDFSHIPPQHQAPQPGREEEMVPSPKYERHDKYSARRLENKVAIITGGDSGIGRAVAIAFAKEGADIAILYLNEHEDADITKKRVQEIGRRCITISGDAGCPIFCKESTLKVMQEFDHIDILVNNCAEQHVREELENLKPEQLERTFRTNIYSYFFMVQAVLPYLKPGSAIINTTSVVAYKGNKDLLDYTSTKGAIVSYTRALAQRLVEKQIRVNGVAPGPIWTPLIPASFSADYVANKFGKDAPMHRMGQPCEVAPSFVFLASEDASYMTGQILHPNGGTPVNG